MASVDPSSNVLLASKKSFEDLTLEMEAGAERLLRSIRSFAGKHQEILTRMKKLQDEGIIRATPHWRQNKYLYLIYPMRKGERRRKYIGADRYKIKEALEAVKRVDEYEFLLQRLSRLENVLSLSHDELNRAVQTLERG
jgi:hypothetical protein